jgi:hypothetical protein
MPPRLPYRCCQRDFWVRFVKFGMQLAVAANSRHQRRRPSARPSVLNQAVEGNPWRWRIAHNDVPYSDPGVRSRNYAAREKASSSPLIAFFCRANACR